MREKVLRILRISLCAAVALFVVVRVVGCAVRWTTARFEGTKLIIGGVTYIHKEFNYAEAGRTIAYVNGWTVSTIQEDPSRTFLRVSSFLDGYGYMREDYEIPTEGEITVVYLDGRYRYTNRQLCEKIAELRENPPPETFTIRTDSIYPYAKPVSVGYEGCPIATELAGYLGHVNGEWVFIFPTEIVYDNGYAETDFLCHVLPEEYVPYFERLPYISEKTAETVSTD